LFFIALLEEGTNNSWFVNATGSWKEKPHGVGEIGGFLILWDFEELFPLEKGT